MGAAADSPNAAQKELKRLEGDWKMVSAELDGQNDARASKMRMVVEDGIATTYYGNTRHEQLRLTVDPGADPKTVDLTPARGGGKTGLGIYRLSEDGNKLEMCYSYDKKRPRKFTTRPGVGSGRILRVYEREKDDAGK